MSRLRIAGSGPGWRRQNDAPSRSGHLAQPETSHAGGRWLALAISTVAALLLSSLVTVAHADVEAGDSVWLGAKVGYGGTGAVPVYETQPADPAAPGEPDFWAFCIEHDVSRRTNTAGVVGDMSTYVGSNHFTSAAVQSKVLWVLAHSYPAMSLADFGAAAGAPAISRDDALEAVQYAIWRYTDLTFDAPWAWESPDSEAAYWYLVNGANASAGLTPADFAVTASLTAPATAQTADSLVGPFVVSTNQATASITGDPAVTLVDATGDPIDASAVVDGQEIYIDQRGSTAAGSATLTIAAQGSSGSGLVLSVPTTNGGIPTEGSHAQSMILIAPSTAETTGDATVAWSSTAPSIGTTLVDGADQDHVLAWSGGTLVDTVAYANLVPGREYTLAGELRNKADGSSTGITGSATFTPTAASGTVDVVFTVPAGHAGEVLVAFEELFEGSTTAGNAVAEHKDLNDAAQTVTVEDEPTVPVTPKTRPKLTTQTSHKVAAPGVRLRDTVKISGFVAGHGATGKATLYGPFPSRAAIACAPAKAVKTVSFRPRNGVIRTPKVRIRKTGFYTWVARTTSDSHNHAASHACGLKSETSLVRKPGYKPPRVDSGYSSRGTAARTLPTTVTISSIGVNASVSTVTAPKDVMRIPSNVATLGRLNKSAAVGDLIGTTVIAGHVSDRHDRPGAFSRLSKVKKGQIVTVKSGGKTVRYRITAVAKFSRDGKLPKRLFRTKGAHGLTLISCTGRVSTPGGGFHYTQNVAVSAKRMG
ncbi:VaFE repeat-containing surface-anchored protein [Nocardioides daejeonensis]|uniref:VaFE repeat-containing surface-anchored protein n=1 Tax=Nocardioides daejeonensis TaxID=1046556 RepID=UPI0013A554DB|nr:VaFE repeat-containing surface-anchored protein [Nocardioides daejeonensis]